MTPRNKPLLVVDDEYSNRDLLSRRLRRAGYEVDTAEDAGQALGIIESREVELVLLDTMMPGMTGVELLKLLRGTYTSMDLPVIMVTALSDSHRVVEALSVGANDYVTKPVDFPVMLARIEAQLNQKWAGEELRQSEERYALAARVGSDGLWDWNLDTGSLYLSPHWKEMLGYGPDEITLNLDEWLASVHPEDRSRFEQVLGCHEQAEQSGELECEYRILHRDGCYRWMKARAAVVCDGRKVKRITGSQTDITKTKAFDPLTGLPNRLGLLERAATALEVARKNSGHWCALLYMDLDRFKLINDSFGHAAGDRLLVAVASRLEQVVRTAASRLGCGGLPARLGGDEFVVFMDKVERNECVEDLALGILEAVRKPVVVEGREVAVSASIGVVLGDGSAGTAADLLRDADTAMYRAKSCGGGRFEVFDEAMREAVQARLEIELDFQRALDNGEFVIHYQPKIRLATGELTGFEALVRWNHPVRGLVGPTEFIGVSEETGHIHQIGALVLRGACEAAVGWRREFGLPLTIAVNVSTKQLHHPDLAAVVKQILDETGLDPSALRLEVTESVLIEKLNEALKTIESLHSLNVGLEIDDFGTGYSSFGYIHALPFDGLKIDKSFIDGFAGNVQRTEVVRAMLSVAGRLGMRVTAEGVETTGQMDWLNQAGCEAGQGYYFSKPMPLEAVPSYIRSLAAQAQEDGSLTQTPRSVP